MANSKKLIYKSPHKMYGLKQERMMANFKLIPSTREQSRVEPFLLYIYCTQAV